MPRLPKFKDVHISPLTGPMNSLTPLDLLNEKQFRYVKNFRVDGAGRLRRIGGLKPLFNDGNYNVTGTIKNNSDLNDQLGSKQSPTNSINEHITLLFEFESGSGSRKLIAATKSRVYALNQRSRNWILIGDNGGSGFAEGTSPSYSPIKFKAAQLGNNIILSNNYDEPLYWYFDNNPKLANKNLVQKITDLVKLKITKAGHVCEYKGFMFLANLEESGSQQIAKVQWSDYVDATSYYPSTSSLSGQQTVGDVGESIIGMAVLGDHLIIYKERSIWRCSLVSSANLFVFKQIYQGENTPYYEDTLINVGSAHFYMSEKAIYRLTISDLYPTRLDWMHNASGIIFEDETVTGEDGAAPRHIIGGIISNKVEQSGTIADVTACPSRPPVITAHPGNLTINANPCSASYTDSSELSVTLTGTEPFSYQWQEKLSSASTWANIADENSSVFKIINPSSSDYYNKQYRVVITNSDGTTTSNHGSITLSGYSTVPSFTLHPKSVTASIGDNATFEVRYCTSVTSFKWRKDTDGSGSGPTDIAHNGSKYIIESGMVPPIGSTVGYYYSKLTVTDVQAADGNSDSNTYSFQATNPSGTTDSLSANIIIPTTVTIKSEGDDFYPVLTADFVGREFVTRNGISYWEGEKKYDWQWLAENGRGAMGDETWGYGSVKLNPTPFRSPSEVTEIGGARANFWGGTVHESSAVWYKPFKWLTLSGTAPYTYEVYRCNDTEGVKTAEAKNIGNGITLSVERIHMTLSVGDIIKFNASGGTAVFTLTQQALFRSNTLTGNLTGHALQDDLVSIRHWNDNDQPVTSFKDSTCDLVAHTVTGCNTSANTSDNITAVTGFSNSNVAAGQVVTGTGVPDNTYVLASPAPTSSTCTLNKAVTSNESNTTLVFGTNTITCNSNKYIEVGQKVAGIGIPKGATVKTINNARAVTSFTLDLPVYSAVNNVELEFWPFLNTGHYAHIGKTKIDTDTIDFSFDVSTTTGDGYKYGKYPISPGWSNTVTSYDAIGKLQGHFKVGYEAMFRVKVTDSSSTPVSSFSDYKWINKYPANDF